MVKIFTFGNHFYPFTSIFTQLYTVFRNSQIVCVVLALDSWNYCSEEEGPTAHLIDKITQSSLYHWIKYINEKEQNKELQPYENPPYHKVAHFLWFNEDIWGKHWDEYFGLCSPEQ